MPSDFYSLATMHNWLLSSMPTWQCTSVNRIIMKKLGPQFAHDM